MAIAVINSETGAVVRTFDRKGDANAFVKAQVQFENAQARLNYFDRTAFPTGELLSR